MDSEETWRRLGDSLGSFIAHRVGNPQDAEDIRQEVLLRIHARIETLVNPNAFVPWANKIARNAIADYYRKAKPTEPLDSELVAPEEEVSMNTGLAGCLEAMVNELPDPYREAIDLVERGGMTQREYAAHSGLSLSGAKTRVQRARKMLKAKVLGCCRVELDRFGNVVDYRHRDNLERYCPK